MQSIRALLGSIRSVSRKVGTDLAFPIFISLRIRYLWSRRRVNCLAVSQSYLLRSQEETPKASQTGPPIALERGWVGHPARCNAATGIVDLGFERAKAKYTPGFCLDYFSLLTFSLLPPNTKLVVHLIDQHYLQLSRLGSLKRA